ncbi:Tol-Pal system protein [Desulfonema limicola]|uniref:histidine kinase n=1 Tax=Desulfonema limicola TaxID=45656 RepID=A0A975B8B3_9BACT|nr:ABC transporter substrate-binding protein [Desulfonema limicola]QTA80511.1 Tol-Pal system protein [Desulfonema limicola]
MMFKNSFNKNLDEFKQIFIFILSTCYIIIASSTVYGGESVTLQLKWYHQFQFAGYYAALEKGYYREEGLDVIIKQGDVEIDSAEEVMEARADFGVSNSGILLHWLTGKPVKVLGVIFQHSPHVFITMKTSGILHPHDMAGRRIGLNKTPRDAELLAALLNEGVLLNQIYPPLGGKCTNSMYYDGSADASSAYITNEPYYLEQKGISYHIIKPITYGVDFYGDILFTSEEQLRKHPKRVRQFRTASLKGWEYAMQNQEELVDIIIKRYGSTKSREHLLYEAEKMQELILPKLVEIGHMNPGRWHHIAETFIRLNMAEPKYSLKGFMYNPDHDKTFEHLVYTIIAVCLGAVTGILILFMLNRKLRRDIEKRKQIEEKLSFQAMILEQIKDAIIATDIQGQITYANEAAALAVKKTPEEITGRNVHILGQDTLSGASQDEIIQNTLKFGKWHGRIVNIADNGTKTFLETRTWKIFDIKGNPKGMIGISTDITDIFKAKEEAEKANHAKSEFLANMSHEIRTPLNSVLGFSEILQNMVTDEKQKNFLNKIHSSGKTLLSLINDILDLSKIDAGKMDINFEPIDIKEIFLDIEFMFQDRFTSKGLEFIYEISHCFPGFLCLDKLRTRQILINLVGNALKFTETGKVVLRAYFLNPGNQEIKNKGKSSIVFEVEDTGIGISKDQQEIIFKSFCQQKGDYSKKYGGTGLGLTISKRLTEIMGGEIIVESEPGKGSIFRLIFPDPEIIVKRSVEHYEAADDNINIKFEPAAILIVDDNEANRELLKEYLSCFPFSLKMAESGEYAMGILEADREFDLVLADIIMPGMDGYTLNQRIKNNKNLKHIPVIAVTASAFKNDMEKLKENFEACLIKPFDKVKLISVLKKFLAYTTEQPGDDKFQTYEKENHGQSQVFSENELKNMPELLNIIEKKLLPEYSDVIEMFYIDDVTDFALQIIKAAEKYNIDILKAYGKGLHNASLNIDVDEIEKNLKDFPEIIEKIKIITGGIS